MIALTESLDRYSSEFLADICNALWAEAARHEVGQNKVVPLWRLADPLEAELSRRGYQWHGDE